MIIKGLFRRRERWNPVHPTYGSFWGVGFGIGCGVGWGPGFGPEVIGYVGSGCGAGFCMGITLLGFGIGLPANSFFKSPSNASMAIKGCASDVSKSKGTDGWMNMGPLISDLRQKIGSKFTTSMMKDYVKNATNVSDMKTKMCLLTKGFLDQMEVISKHESKGSTD
ncbi:unnamed protein product [Cuscuta epithymum]|uniref:Cadmium-induced protein AS8 n=1 Tax=Cuscuta epithymum TaxID=186058 RepID=A0AAV0CRB6_9ASTE|nr:unnamed protein product [Cuscuta epithymum]